MAAAIIDASHSLVIDEEIMFKIHLIIKICIQLFVCILLMINHNYLPSSLFLSLSLTRYFPFSFSSSEKTWLFHLNKYTLEQCTNTFIFSALDQHTYISVLYDSPWSLTILIFTQRQIGKFSGMLPKWPNDPYFED